MNAAISNALEEMDREDDLFTYAQAMASPHRKEWLDAIEKEMESFVTKEVYDVVSSVPHGRKALTAKWVLKIKHDAFGNFVKFKARLVARGFLQEFGKDYFSSYAPVMTRRQSSHLTRSRSPS